MLAIGSDHAGYELKCEVKKFLDGLGVEYIDCGCNGERADYPDIAEKTCEKIKSGECDKGILICGTGIGMSICANKFNGIRAVNSSDEFCIERSRMHNNANVICLGASLIDTEKAFELIRTFISTDFEGGRHQKRVEMMND